MRFKKIEVKSNSGNPTDYLKLQDGQSISGVFRGEVYSFFIKWNEGKTEEVIEGTPGAKQRFRLNFVIWENDRFIAKIWDFGVPFYNDLAEMNEVYPLQETKVKITRKGIKLGTIYNIIPLLNEKDKLHPNHKIEIEKVQLNVLNPKSKFAPPGPEGEPEEWNGF